MLLQCDIRQNIAYFLLAVQNNLKRVMTSIYTITEEVKTNILTEKSMACQIPRVIYDYMNNQQTKYLKTPDFPS